MRSPATKEIVYPLHLHLPLFIKRQVFVNFAPRVICALSGTVTSSRRIALSWHGPESDTDAVPSGVPGVVVVDASGVEVGGISVGRDKPGFVGGRVDVMKTDLVGAGVSSETLTQEPRLRLVSRINIHRIGSQIFFIMGILLGKY